MGRYAFLLWVALLGVVVFQGVRTAQLEKRLEGATGAAARDRQTDEIAALEADVAELSERVQAIESAAGGAVGAVGAGTQAVGAAPTTPEKAQEILSLVERENRRVLDKHLRYHRERLIENRQTALDDFSERHRLTPQQQQRVHRLLIAETDAMFAILGRREFAEDPERAGMEIRALFEATDRNTATLLDAKQFEAWTQGRAFERAVFMPWLPKY